MADGQSRGHRRAQTGYGLIGLSRILSLAVGKEGCSGYRSKSERTTVNVSGES